MGANWVLAMILPPSIHAFWNGFASAVGEDRSDRFYEAFYFGDSQPVADELAALVLAGKKRATTGLLWTNEAEGKPLPKAGDLSVVTLFSGLPVCIIETLSVQILPFRDVDAEFAATEGEGDGSLEYWQQAHTEFFGRQCQRLGREFSPSALVACEKFVVVYPV
jgi:uncharacterized protein YhfF